MVRAARLLFSAFLGLAPRAVSGSRIEDIRPKLAFIGAKFFDQFLAIRLAAEPLALCIPW